MGDAGGTPAVTEGRSPSAWIVLAIPGAVGLYAVLGAMWHPLLLGPGYDSFDCVRRPWDFVVRGSWLTGVILILVAIVVAITGRGLTGLTLAVSGILLIAAGGLVLAVVAVHEYHLCDS
jgi:hypothetical protein